jgi:hypothetical protein
MKSPDIQLEIIPEDEQQQDLGDVAERSQNMIDYLTRNGCTVTPTYTGRMGSPIYDVLVHAYHIVHSNEELLTALFASLTAMLKLIGDHNKSRETKNISLVPAPTPVEIDLPTENGPVTIDAIPNLCNGEQREGAKLRLALAPELFCSVPLHKI